MRKKSRVTLLMLRKLRDLRRSKKMRKIGRMISMIDLMLCKDRLLRIEEFKEEHPIVEACRTRREKPKIKDCVLSARRDKT